MSQYTRIAKKTSDVLYRIKYDYGLDYLAIIIYKVRVTTSYSFGPNDAALIDELLVRGVF